MKNLILISIIIVLLFSSKFSISQNFGYMGKKNIVSVETNFGLAIRSGGKTFDGIKSTAIFSYNRVYKENRILSFEYHYFKDYTQVRFDEYSYDNFYNTYYYKENSFGLGYKMFTSDIAPVGAYFKLSLLVNSISVDEDINFSNPEKKYTLKAGIGMGQNRVIADNFVLNYGFNAYLNSTILSSFYSIISEEKETLNQKAKIAQYSIYRDLFYFNVGIGYLF